jgi:hypothetical protein
MKWKKSPQIKTGGFRPFFSEKDGKKRNRKRGQIFLHSTSLQMHTFYQMTD